MNSDVQFLEIETGRGGGGGGGRRSLHCALSAYDETDLRLLLWGLEADLADLGSVDGGGVGPLVARFGDLGSGERETSLGGRSGSHDVGVVGGGGVAGGRGALGRREALWLGRLDGLMNAWLREETGVDCVERADGRVVLMVLSWY